MILPGGSDDAIDDQRGADLGGDHPKAVTAFELSDQQEVTPP
jgi:hypothetical protein